MLEVSNLAVSYGEVRALRDITLSVEAGSFTVLLGPNGAGKTTLLKTISGVISPRQGTVTFKGERIDDKEPNEILLSGLAHIPEGGRVFPGMTVLENLRIGGYLIDDSAELEAALDQVYSLFPRLEERKEQRAASLSGGERQMLSIGRGLMTDPDLLLIDEPSLGLAPSLVDATFERLEDLNESGLTILLTEQIVDRALELADYGYVLDSSRLVEEGVPSGLGEGVVESYFGVRE